MARQEKIGKPSKKKRAGSRTRLAGPAAKAKLASSPSLSSSDPNPVSKRTTYERNHALKPLKVSEKLFRMLFENMLDGYAYCRMLYDRRGRPSDFIYLAVNSAFGRLTGLEDVVGRKVTDVIPGIRETHPELLEVYGRVAATGRSEKFEIEFKPLDIWFSISVYSTDRGYFTAVFDNITERKRAEKTIREREQKYRALIDRMIDGFALHEIVKDASGLPRDYRFLEVNSAFERLTGLRGADIIGKCVTQVLPDIRKSDFDWIAAYGNVALTGVELRTEQYSGVLKKWYSISAYSPEMGYFATIFEDITPRKNAEEALLQNEIDLNRAQEVGGIGSWRLDVRRNVLTWSDENHHIFGIPKGMPLTYETFLSAVHPDDREHVDRRWKAGLGGEPYDIEHRLLVNGQIKWVREKAYLEFDRDGSLIGGFGITQDITKRKASEDALQKLNNELEQRIAQRTRFYAVRAAVSEAIVRIREQQALLDEVCRIIVETGGFRLAWVGLADPASRELINVSRCGEAAYLDGLRFIAGDVPEGKGAAGRAVVEGHPVIDEDFETSESLAPWRERARNHGIRAVSSFPLRSGGQVVGALTIYSDRPGFFAGEEAQLLESLAEDISFALDTIANERRRKEAEQRTEVSNKLLWLFTRKLDRKDYLDAALAVISSWIGCHHAGIRILGQDDNLPFETCQGYNEKFLATETVLSLREDDCICTRIAMGKPISTDSASMTHGGSFFSGDVQRFYGGIPQRERAGYRSHCITAGFRSLAIIPIRYRDEHVGAIHLADERSGIFRPELVEFLEYLSFIIGEVIQRFSIEEERARLASAVQSATDAVVVTDRRGIIKYVNPAFERITGYERDEVLSRDLHFLDSGKHGAAFYSKLRDDLVRDGAWSGQLMNRKKDGSLYYEECTIAPVRGPSGEIINFVSVRRDVTDKLRLESIAESVNTMDNIGYVFSGVRHEIGNPINSINAILTVLRSKLDSLSQESVRGYIDRTIEQISRVEYILRSLKSFNLYETQELQNVNISAFFESFLPLVKDDFAKKGAEILTELDAGSGWAYTDPRALQQVLLNILTNAADSTAGRVGPKVALRVRLSGGAVHIQVQDNGHGIPEERLKEIFKPFYTTKQHGTGLGLVIVKKMLARMQGTIEISSRRNEGTTVDITIPSGTPVPD